MPPRHDKESPALAHRADQEGAAAAAHPASRTPAPQTRRARARDPGPARSSRGRRRRMSNAIRGGALDGREAGRRPADPRRVVERTCRRTVARRRLLVRSEASATAPIENPTRIAGGWKVADAYRARASQHLALVDTWLAAAKNRQRVPSVRLQPKAAGLSPGGPGVGWRSVHGIMIGGGAPPPREDRPPPGAKHNRRAGRAQRAALGWGPGHKYSEGTP